MQEFFHQSYVSGLIRSVSGSVDMKEIGALRTMSVVPSFPKDGRTEPSFILPLMISRYSHDGKSFHRNPRKVIVPSEIDFNPYLIFEGFSGSSFLLKLTGLVCHQGDSLQSGHYISFAFDDEELYRHSKPFSHFIS